MFADRTLTCISCGREFLFSSDEQAFFRERNFQNDPKRCKTCRAVRAGVSVVRIETRLTCAGCGELTTVPFKPRQGRPVLCRSCFQRAAERPVSERAVTPVDPTQDAA